MSEYMLGGQVHLPGKANEFGKGAKPFTAVFRGVDDDDDAIRQAEQVIKEEQQLTKDGEVVSATLWNGDRMVKDFPES